jgi:hypothetical protein
MAALITNCSDDPDVVISSEACGGTLYGVVSPTSIKADVYLLNDTDTVAVYSTDGKSGNYHFDEVPFGIYSIVAVGQNYYAETKVYVNNAYVLRENIRMLTGNKYIQVFGSVATDTIKFENVYKDKTITIGFQTELNSVFDTLAYTMVPSRLLDGCTIDIRAKSNMAIEFQTDSLFKVESLQVKVRYITRFSNGSEKKDSLVYTCVIDSAGLNRSRTDQLIKQFRVGDNRYTFSDVDEHVIRNINPEHPVSVVFNQGMDWKTVQKSIRIDPPVALNFFWSSDTLTLTPSNALKPGCSYTVTIDTSAMTVDSLFFRCIYSVIITTANTTFFSNFWPLDGTESTSLLVPFTFESPFIIDPVDFEKAFTIRSSIDSLIFIQKEQRVVSVYHAPLEPATTYKIVIDSTFMSRKGTALGTEFSISFITADKR